MPVSVRASPSVPLCVSGIVRAVHQSSSKLGDTPLARLDLFESLPSRQFHCRAVEPLQQTLQQNRALHRSTTHPPRPAADVELYSSTARSPALQLYSALHPLHPTPSLRVWSKALRAGFLFGIRLRYPTARCLNPHPCFAPGWCIFRAHYGVGEATFGRWLLCGSCLALGDLGSAVHSLCVFCLCTATGHLHNFPGVL